MTGFFRKLWEKIKLFFRPWMPWVNIIKIIVTKFFSIITNPSYIIFSIVAIGLSTMGIWIVFYPEGFKGDNLTEQLENMSVFTFCIATLGNIATEYFFDEGGNNAGIGSTLDKRQTQHLAFLLWSISLLFTFIALQKDDFIFPCLGVTILLWLFVNINRSKFQNIDKTALQNLDPNLNNSSDGLNSEIEGDGL